jgi:hypothetical protein
MFDASLCASMVVGPPQVSLAGLEELRAILDSRAGGSIGSWKCLQKEGPIHEPTDEKRSRVQLQLPLELVSVRPHPLEHVRSEAIEVLADLLLEAMGPEENGSVEVEEVSDERKNHA